MFKNGQFYLTTKGQLVKIFDTFKFGDGYTMNAAVYVTDQNQWLAMRYTPDGMCNQGAEFNIIATETYDKYRNYLTFSVFYDKLITAWRGRAMDPRGSVIVDLADIQNPERSMQLIQMGAEQKLLTWMREAGYDEDKKETV